MLAIDINKKRKNRSTGPEFISQTSNFARHNHTYVINDMHMNNIRIHSHLFVDITKEKNTKYSDQTETSFDSDRQIILV